MEDSQNKYKRLDIRKYTLPELEINSPKSVKLPISWFSSVKVSSMTSQDCCSKSVWLSAAALMQGKLIKTAKINATINSFDLIKFLLLN